MKVECIKSDPLGWVVEGKTYECKKKGTTMVLYNERGKIVFAISERIFNRHFKEL